MRKTKKQLVTEFLQSGDYKNALKIAKSFNIELSKEQKSIVTRAYEMQWNSKFYEALGFNKEQEFEKAINILKQIYC